MFSYQRFAVAASMCLAMATQPVTAQEHREYGAHVHGAGRLNVALEGNTLEIELDSPAMNLIGFEHEAHSKAEHEQRDNALARLRQGERLFVLPASAGCRLVSAKVAEEGESHAHEAEAEHLHEESDAEEHHSDIIAHYHFECTAPSELDGIDVRLFEQFPATHELEVQYIGPGGQGAAELTAGEHQLRF